MRSILKNRKPLAIVAASCGLADSYPQQQLAFQINFFSQHNHLKTGQFRRSSRIVKRVDKSRERSQMLHQCMTFAWPWPYRTAALQSAGRVTVKLVAKAGSVNAARQPSAQIASPRVSARSGTDR